MLTTMPSVAVVVALLPLQLLSCWTGGGRSVLLLIPYVVFVQVVQSSSEGVWKARARRTRCVFTFECARAAVCG